MNTIEAIKARRSVKHYDPQHKFSQEEIDELMSLAILAPTAFNLQNWRFVLVQNPELRKEIRAVSWDQAQVTDASLLIVVCADLKAWEKEGVRVDDATTTPSTEYCCSIRTDCAGSVSSDKLTSKGRRPRSCKPRVNKSKTSKNIGL